MKFHSLYWGLATGFLLLVVSGCASGPKYVEPIKPDVAVLKGSWGTYIRSVDHEEVDGSALQFANIGSNSVHVSPGEHDLRIETNCGNVKQWVTFRFRADGGHQYEFHQKNMVDLTLKVKDLTTGQTMLIN